MKLFVIVVFFVLYMSCGVTKSQAQTCNDRILLSIPDDRLELVGDDVKDLKTGLVWQRCSIGQSWDGVTCIGSATTHTWSMALALADGNWRLPNIKELSSIVERACLFPTANLNFFPKTISSYYWSSTSDSLNNDHQAWIVNFGYGEFRSNYKFGTAYVRLVGDE